VTLKVFNTRGQIVATLVDKKLPAGSHKVDWHPANLPSGVYIYTIEAARCQDMKKLVLIR
jgi:hypothetical protein